MIYFLLILISYSLTWVVRKIALKKSLLDIPNERSSHLIPIPRGGGIALAFTWFIAISYWYFSNQINSNIYFALLCGLPISAIGLIDDVVKVSPVVRFIVQITAASIAVFFLNGIDTVDLGIWQIKIPFFLNILAVIGIVWFTNLFNFLDGIDGYLSMEIIFITISSYFLFGIELPLILACVSLGFLAWNWQPAKIFMGDVGSTLLGFTIGVFTVSYQNSPNASILTWLMLTSVFWFDATLTLFRRWLNHEDITKAHRKHAYQRIVQAGFSHQKTVLYSFLINLIILVLVYLSMLFPFFVILFFLLDIFILYLVIIFIDKRFHFN